MKDKKKFKLSNVTIKRIGLVRQPAVPRARFLLMKSASSPAPPAANALVEKLNELLAVVRKQLPTKKEEAEMKISDLTLEQLTEANAALVKSIGDAAVEAFKKSPPASTTQPPTPTKSPEVVDLEKRIKELEDKLPKPESPIERLQKSVDALAKKVETLGKGGSRQVKHGASGDEDGEPVEKVHDIFKGVLLGTEVGDIEETEDGEEEAEPAETEQAK